MLQIGAALLAGIIATTAYLYSYVLSKRRELDGLPCPPMKSRLFGHLDIAGECDKLFPRNCHKHLWIRYMQKRWGMGDYFYIDWWPLGPRWLFIADPELSNQFVTVQQSLPKSSLEVDYIVKFLGESNMITVEGQKWKYLRSIFNPGFSAGHLMTLTGYIVDASATFYKLIREKAETGELFELEEYAMKLTIDIIGKVVLDSDFESQTRSHPIVEAFRERAYLLPVTGVLLDFSSLELIRRFKTWRNGIKLDRLIGEELDRKMAAHAAQDNRPTSFKGRKRSVVDLALDAYMKERSSNGASTNGSAKNMNGSAKLPAMDATFRQDAIDSMKSFIFAGHDTTASTIAYLFYMLHFHPDVHKKVVAELDAVFSPGATSEEIGNAIKENPHIINTLEYTTAVLKETLRLFPPGSTLRYTPPSKGHSKTQHLIDPKTGQKLPIEGFHIWPAVSLINRNEAFFPKPVEFVPERFIQSQNPFPESKLFSPAGKDAFRPFEKGPRNCIGQELAMIESRIIVAMTVRDFDFVAEFGGVKCEQVRPVETFDEFADGRRGDDRRTIEGHSCYQVLKGAAKPRDGMPGRMSFRTS